MTKLLGKFLAGVTVVASYTALIALLLLFIWNAGIVWLFPSFGSMDYLNALGITSLGVFLHLLTNFWVKRYTHVQSAKSLKALELVESFERELALIKLLLINKGIL